MKFCCYPFFFQCARVFSLIGSHMEACNTRWSSLNKIGLFFFSAMYAVPAYDLITAQGNVYHLSTLSNDACNSFQRDLENIRRDLKDLRMCNGLRSCSICSRRTITPRIEPMIHPSYSSVYNDHLVASRNPWVTYRPIVHTQHQTRSSLDSHWNKDEYNPNYPYQRRMTSRYVP